ncbi:MAG TPA: LysR substrate-binding domain-containing protein, partial [Polyangiaceae bacterium]|nr:LysR substrate-binding domain-containing protein [Polyangiaceae bacterium]
PEGDREGLVDRKLAEQGLTRRLGLSLPQMYAAPRIIASSDLIATLMEGVVVSSANAQVNVFEPPLDLPRASFVLAWHRRNDSHPAQRWFREAISNAGKMLA